MLGWTDGASTTKPCHVRSCNTFTFKPDVINVQRQSPVRKQMHNAVKAPTGTVESMHAYVCGRGRILSNVQQFYKDWKLCESPLLLDLTIYSIETWYTTYMYLTEYLHYLYGNAVVPGVLYLYDDSDGLQITRFVWGLNDKHTPKETFEDIIMSIRSSSQCHHVAWVAVPSSRGTNGHAMVMIISKYSDKMFIEIIDPNMEGTRDSSEFTSKLLTYLTRHEKRMKYKVKGTMVHKQLAGTFHGADAKFPRSSLDYGGYCGLWSLMIMEIIARSSRGSSKDVSDILAGEITFKNATPAIWRKIVIDYFFTRILDSYVLASTFYYKPVMLFLEANFTDRYINDMNSNDAFKNIISYIPWFEDEVYDRLP